MKTLLISLFEKNEHHFHEGGKLAKFYPAYEAFQTFVYNPKLVAKRGPHVRDSLDTKRYMSIVIASLMPCLAFGIYNVGYQAHLAAGLPMDAVAVVLAGLKAVLPLLLVSYAVGLGIEFLFAIIRKHEINEGFLVTGLLYPLILPPTLPLWQAAVGIAFGVIIGKEVFGGSGRNFLNPALTARAFVFFTYPGRMSGDSVWTDIIVAKDQLVDSFTGATSLAVAAASTTETGPVKALQDAGFNWHDLFWGLTPGSIGETSTFAVLLGAGLLLITGVGSWRTMLGCVLGTVAMSAVYQFIAGPDSVAFMSLPAHYHLVMGGFAFGAVFMATDPVSSPHLDGAKLYYGILIGVLAVTIRCINPAYPEGMMLAILLMNVFAPLLDHVMMQRRLGRRIPNVI